MKAMILAAGLGTRLKPWTDHHPKALALVNGKSLLQRNIEYLQSFGIGQVIINVHHFAGQILEAIEKNNGWGSDIVISDETDEVLETGGGLKKVSGYFASGKEPFVLMNADILTDLDLYKMIDEHKAVSALATLAVADRPSSRYLMFTDENLLCGWINEKTGEVKGESAIKKAFSGIHVIEPELLGLMREQGKFSMIDIYLRLCNDHKIYGYDHTGDLLLDVGKPESIAQAEKQFP